MVTIVRGDLLDQEVEVIVNPWNRNFIPYWLLWPQGVSGAIRRRAGAAPFKILSRHGTLPVGAAVVTTAGALPFIAIIHVASLNWFWTSSEKAIRLSTANALAAAKGRFSSIAFPLIGAGTGGVKPEMAETYMMEEIEKVDFPGDVLVVHYDPNARPPEKPAATDTGQYSGRIAKSLQTANDYIATHMVNEFRVDWFDGSRLWVVGGFDLSYYHEIAIVFHDVSRMSVNVDFFPANLTPAFLALETIEDGEPLILVTWRDDENRRYEVVCEDLEARIGLVRYYDAKGVFVDWRKSEPYMDRRVASGSVRDPHSDPER